MSYRYFIPLFFVLSMVFAPAVLAGSAIEGIRDAVNQTSKEAGLGENAASEGEGQDTITEIIGSIVNIVVGVLGVIAVALMVYAGGLWLTSAGNDQKVSKAKTIIQSVVIGIIIVSLAYALTTFVITQLASGG